MFSASEDDEGSVWCEDDSINSAEADPNKGAVAEETTDMALVGPFLLFPLFVL